MLFHISVHVVVEIFGARVGMSHAIVDPVDLVGRLLRQIGLDVGFLFQGLQN
jgi:hypothetical protein